MRPNSSFSDHTRSEAEFTSAARLAEEAGYEREAAWATFGVYDCALRDPERHVELERRMNDLIATCGRTGDNSMLHQAREFLGRLYWIQGKYEEALLKYQASIAQNLSRSNHGTLIDIGFCEWLLDRPGEAEKRFRQVLGEEREGTRSPGNTSFALLGMAVVASVPERSLCLLVSSETLMDSAGASLDPADQLKVDGVMDRLKGSIDPGKFNAISDASRRLSMDEAVAYALGELDLPWVTSGG